jgi:ADP-ribose pyrophosphatase YjhB (NUDIX family)
VEEKHKKGAIFIQASHRLFSWMIEDGYQIHNFDHDKPRSAILQFYKWNDSTRSDRVPPFFTASMGAGLIVMSADRKRCLLVKETGRNKQIKWKPVTGHVNIGELPEQTAPRELKEETGGVVDTKTLVYLERFDEKGDGKFPWGNRNHVCFFFGAILEGNESDLKAMDEVEEIRWFNVDDLPMDQVDTTMFGDISFKGQVFSRPGLFCLQMFLAGKGRLPAARSSSGRIVFY